MERWHGALESCCLRLKVFGGETEQANYGKRIAGSIVHGLLSWQTSFLRDLLAAGGATAEGALSSELWQLLAAERQDLFPQQFVLDVPDQCHGWELLRSSASFAKPSATLLSSL
jgi:hypothetical protein